MEALLSRENAIQDAAAFTEHLSEELAQLDEANIHALMGSETQIRDLMSHIDQALYEIEQMESKLRWVWTIVLLDNWLLGNNPLARRGHSVCVLADGSGWINNTRSLFSLVHPVCTTVFSVELEAPSRR